MFDAQVDQFTFPANAFAVKNIEFGLTERRGNFVFDDFDFGFVTNHVIAFFNLTGTADVEADRGIEFERVTAGCGFRAAEHHADFHTDLVNENNQCIGAFDVAGQFAQGLAHQAGLQADVAVAHFAFDLGFRHKCGYGVDNDHIDTAGAYQGITDFQCLFAGIRLGEIEFFNFYAEFAGVNRVKSMLGIDECADAAIFLALGNGFETECSFTGGFRAENFNHAAAGQAADAEC